jgi:hypothetical protein
MGEIRCSKSWCVVGLLCVCAPNTALCSSGRQGDGLTLNLCCCVRPPKLRIRMWTTTLVLKNHVDIRRILGHA